jgi:hypothetical protein
MSIRLLHPLGDHAKPPLLRSHVAAQEVSWQDPGLAALAM